MWAAIIAFAITLLKEFLTNAAQSGGSVVGTEVGKVLTAQADSTGQPNPVQVLQSNPTPQTLAALEQRIVADTEADPVFKKKVAQAICQDTTTFEHLGRSSNAEMWKKLGYDFSFEETFFFITGDCPVGCEDLPASGVWYYAADKTLLSVVGPEKSSMENPIERKLPRGAYASCPQGHTWSVYGPPSRTS
jgi:hypothetical protein